ncbi:MAG: TonB family protein [Acidobacteria bacterium]|nr:TonB family protein [Acidobacteriota bacterium]MBV9478320.1 TonB family protein [Acidobacteriota bacterium]
MAARNKPYDSFGPYILFKKLETDAIGELWRAGRIDGAQLGPTVALRRLTGGNRAALTASAEAAAQILPQLTGTSFAREQVAGVADGVPFVAWDYAGGRSLRHIIDRGRGGKDTPPNPLPIDQAIVIAEKVALSLATTADLRSGGGRLSHGALLPQMIWISDDGEIRVAGQQLGAGMLASLQDARVAAEIGRYFCPESRNAAQPVKNADVYSMGAILFLLVTGQEPPDAATASAFGAAVRAAKTLTGAPVPDDIRVVLDKSFNIDPSMRYASIGEMKQAISGLAHGGKYSATTFNLAFYLSNLLKKELEAEALDRDKESKVNVLPYLEAPKPVAVPAPAYEPSPAPSMFASADAPKSKSKLPLVAAAALVVAGVGLGAYYMMSKHSTTAAAPAPLSTAQVLPGVTAQQQPAQHRIISEPVVASASPQTSTATPAAPATTDAEAQKKAFEDAVRRKMNEEMMKLQNQFNAELRQKQSKNAPVVTAPPVSVASSTPAPAVSDDRPSLSAAQLDQQQRRESAPARTTPVDPTPAAPAQTQSSAPVQQVVTQAPAAQTAGVHEGDVVDVSALDTLPRPTRAIRPMYPAMAAQQKVSATIILSAFIGENGEVLDVKVLRGEPRFGLNEAAMRAIRSTRFTPPVKDGKHVRTWFPQSIEFRP